MIEIRQQLPQSGGIYQLFVDGRLLNNVSLTVFPGETPTSKFFHIRVNGYDGSAKIAAHRFSEIPSSILDLILTYSLEWADLPVNISIEKDSLNQSYKFRVNFIGYASWRGAFSLADYVEELREVILEAEHSEIETRDAFPHDFEFLNISSEKNIADEIARFSDMLRPLSEEAKRRLTARIHQNSVVMQFDFPEEVRVPCEQYLLYFAQFLRDLGVSAETALTHEAGQVLFTVTPEDKEQALDNIRAALEVYLHLPSSPVGDTRQDEIAVLRLNSELQNLHSKLSLAKAELQMKDAAIQLQRVTIAQLTGEVVIDSLKNVTPNPKDKDKEELLGDIVSLVPLKGKGFEVNLPELLRRLKLLFKKDE